MLPCPPYDAPALDVLRKELDDRYIPMIDSEEKQIRDELEAHKDKSAVKAVIGILVLTGGFFLQLVSTVMTSRVPAPVSTEQAHATSGAAAKALSQPDQDHKRATGS